MAKQSVQTQSQPYSNMAARKTVLVLGFVMTCVGFVAALYATLVFFFPTLNFLNGVLAIDLMTWLYIASLSLSFVGIVFSVSGANTMKGLARLSFFFGTLSFIMSAALLVVILLFTTLIPM